MVTLPFSSCKIAQSGHQPSIFGAIMHFHPVVAQLPEKEQLKILNRFREVFFECSKKEMRLFGDLNVEHEKFFLGSRSLVGEYLDFFLSVLQKRVEGENVIVAKGGIFNREIEAIASLDDLTPNEKQKLEGVILFILQESPVLLDGVRYYEPILNEALRRYLCNPAVKDSDAIRVVSNILLHGFNADALEQSLETMRLAIWKAMKPFIADPSVSKDKRQAVLDAARKSLVEADEMARKVHGGSLDESRTKLYNRFHNYDVKDLESNKDSKFSTARLYETLGDILLLDIPGYVHDACKLCIEAMRDDSVDLNADFVKLFIDFRIKLAGGHSAFNKDQELTSEVSNQIQRLIEISCEKGILDEGDRHEISFDLWSSVSSFSRSSAFNDMCTVISSGLTFSADELYDALSSHAFGCNFIDVIGGKCHSSPLSNDELMTLFDDAVAEYDGEPENSIRDLSSGFWAFAKNLFHRQLYQCFLPAMLSGGCDYNRLAKVIVVGLEKKLFDEDEFRLFPDVSIRKLYETGNEKLMEFINGNPALNERFTNRLLMEKVEQLTSDGPIHSRRMRSL